MPSLSPSPPRKPLRECLIFAPHQDCADNSVGSGYLFPSRDSPKYTKGLTVEVALSVGGMIFTAIYQILIKWENAKRDKREGGPPAPGFRPDTATYADDAPGFRYIG